MGMSPRAAELLRVVHESPGTTRADAARAIGIGTGAATEVVAQLAAAELVGERPAQRTGGRGRPTTVLVPHERGPLVLAVSITHEAWLLQAVEIGGAVVAGAGSAETGSGDDDADGAGRDAPVVLADIRAAVTRLRRRFPRRVRAIGVAAPGTVAGTTVGHATGRSWRNLDLRAIWPRAEFFVAGNDATLAAAAESSRGAAVGAEVALHIRLQAGVGGAVVDRGRVLTGAHGFGGEFGHVPLGDPAVTCPCGASGCWGTAVDGSALARLLGRREPRDPVAFLDRAASAASTDARTRAAVGAVVDALGRGVAGFVNAIDPDVVTLGGSAVPLMRAEPQRLAAAYDAGLMRVRRDAPPMLLPAALGEQGPVTGAAELAWQAVWAHL
ncbi:Sugar kinase of the NBD/HSP70 family, may contain an N-terminal HTH domain [Jatrophihabitans endophyticus]|uniref:Sugar kinase of the NBD/HSP70 family, may contain an N-terminal HTH domain n=1 Tax=Jatrophihabitans endophyticus TaxID=1206085 RepID=A0A1M5T6V2_9ACTN|nr:ROK family protein [Jatrophihabitans endophyticus]SHH46444.1 Sugar kinase of the NBD/HSP70 family, may contain an N-terminal HTH domain [Jatrophihabitans endophyticus]